MKAFLLITGVLVCLMLDATCVSTIVKAGGWSEYQANNVFADVAVMFVIVWHIMYAIGVWCAINEKV